VFYLSWTMPRLESRGVHPSTIPGLVPMILGGLLAFSGLLLAVRAWRQGADLRISPVDSLRTLLTNDESQRLAVMVVLTLSYALVLVGWLPFWLATGLYVFVSIVVFERYLTSEPRPLIRCLILAGIQSVLIAAVVTLTFQEGFLVRLP
ncbi:MAG: tripartite tricarboxylate transporter TctB family protein, partial [Natronospirillum sp.]